MQSNVVINVNEHTYAEHKLLNKLIILFNKKKMQIITPCISRLGLILHPLNGFTPNVFASQLNRKTNIRHGWNSIKHHTIIIILCTERIKGNK